MSRLSIDQPAIYAIRVQGVLDSQYSEFLGGLNITHEVNENDLVVSVLNGRLMDQAALFGELYNMLLPLLSVEFQSDTTSQ